jgi:DNA-binding NarL/FixJ family response regulator
MAMCRHSPPRLGLVFAAAADVGGKVKSETLRRNAAPATDLHDDPDQPWLPGTFSERQWDILVRLVRGEGIQDIADDLYISPSTVRNHLTAIYRKLGVHSQAAVLAKLIETRGLL